MATSLEQQQQQQQQQPPLIEGEDATTVTAAEVPVSAPPAELTPAQQLAAEIESQDPSSTNGDHKAQKHKLSPVPKLDVASADAFPTLGGGAAKAAAPIKWGSGPGPVLNADPAPQNWAPGAPVSGGREARPQLLFTLQREDKKHAGDIYGGKSVSEAAREIAKRTSTKMEDVNNKERGSTTWVISGGTAQDRDLAKRLLSRELAVKVSRKITIPSAALTHVIGKGGSKIKELQAKTFTRIQIPDTKEIEEGDEESTSEVEILGDAENCKLAIALIRNIVKERIIKVVRQIEAPGQFYPFIQGNIFEYEFLVDKVTVPDYISSTTEPPNFSAPSGPIEVAGEKTAVETVVLQIREKLAKMEGEGYTTRGVELGPSEGNLLTFNDAQIPKEVFAETGCAVFTTPKADRAILFGPSSDLLASMMVLYNKVMGYKIVSLDLAKALTTAPKVSHAIDVVRYVQTTGKGELIENELDITLVFPNLEALHDLEVLHNLEFLHDLKEPCLIITIGKSQESVKAASKRVEDLLTAYTPNCITRFKVEPLNIKHIHGKDTLGAQRITDATSVELLFPKDPEDEEITLIYGGESKADEEIKEALEKAKAEINEVLKGHPEIVKKVLDVPQEFHEKLNGSNGAIIRALIPAGVAVQFGAPKVRAGRAASAVPAGAENTITLRGPPTSVTTTATDIRAFLAANKDRDFAETITESFLYPKLFSGNLIGAKGSNLTKLRDQYAVDIKLGEGKGEIKGVKVCVDAARRNLQAQIKELEDKAVLSIRIPKAFHSGIVGQGGATIRRLEERYSVRINIPNADDENTHQAPDEIIIRGRKLGAEQARQEIIELYEYEAENSHEAKLKIKASAVTFVFKNSNNDIKHICDVVGARVRLPRYDEPTDKDGNVPIIITGTKEAVAQAKATMTKIIKLAEDTTSETIYVDKRFHRTLIGTGGSALNKIVLESGATEDRASLARLVHFPAQGENSDEIKVTGPAAVVKKIVAAINAIVAGLASQVSTTIQVAPEKHRKLIGAQGIIRRDLETKHGVTIDIPRQRPGTPQTNADIKITGPPAAVEEAKNHILGMVKETEGETLEVPRRLHSAIAEGTFFKYLQKNFGVTIEHHGARPKRPEDPKPTGGNNLPTITDEDDGDRVSWEIVENAASGEEGTYPWIIRGKADGIAKAKKEILAALATAEKQSYTGFLILPDPGKYRFVVGPNGSTVDRIRRETGCKITVPRAGGAEAITLHGDKEGLEKAKTKILEVVRNQQQPKGKRSSE